MILSLTLLSRVATVVFVVCIPILLIASNVRYAANEERLYQYSFDQYDAESVTGIPRRELDRAASELVQYFNDDQHAIATRVTAESGEEISLYNDRETLHLIDVKALFRLVFRLQELALVVALTYVAFFFILRRWTQPSRLATEVMTGAMLTVAIVLGLGAFALIGFDDLFRRFHLLAFTNDLWQLNPRTDRLIQMFPQGFWFDVTLLIGVLMVLEATVLSLPAFAYLRWSQRHEEHSLEEEKASRTSK